jgi:hypothetical protein
MPNPQMMKRVLTIALQFAGCLRTVIFNESFYTRFEESDSFTTHSPNRVSCERVIPNRSAETNTGSRMRGQHRRLVRGTRKSFASEVSRNPQTKADIKCFNAKGKGVTLENDLNSREEEIHRAI